MLFQATQFVVPCYGSRRKPINSLLPLFNKGLSNNLLLCHLASVLASLYATLHAEVRVGLKGTSDHIVALIKNF